jgi:hypothetical protein
MVTTKGRLPLMLFKVAVMVVDPAATPLNNPVAFTEATSPLEAVHTAVVVTFAVDPSL